MTGDVTVLPSHLARAAQIAKAMTADPVTGQGRPWKALGGA